ncbi:unnamed protein product, partial [Vitis vinifera]
ICKTARLVWKTGFLAHFTRSFRLSEPPNLDLKPTRIEFKMKNTQPKLNPNTNTCPGLSKS